MAAGMGSRYGGLKQIDPIDKEGHIIMDFSIYDAVRAGFEKVVFIIKKENEESYYGTMRTKLYNFFIDKGVILRPVGNIVYILPPYIMTDDQLQKVYTIIEEAIEIV